ncbi:ankyrin repeat and SOCS box protein 15b isoform X1 [Gadus chalcogrammus]|uniref:ankyrin repeat and SOCS box protein 15b isoform X1 n=1 Tax=Gadus chalcogrammus TaxID=1042646 RepID=UPI0024C48527|nr:ankyrin repeat and SOCS box protein 15b isoform X1 [Gadus chalcogrammus]
MADAEHDGIDEELFQYAIQQSLQDTCRRTGDAHSKGNKPQNEDFLKILSAIDQGDEEALARLSGCVWGFRQRDDQGNLPLHRAASQLSPRVLELVLQGMASSEESLEEQAGCGGTALTLAAHAGLGLNVGLLLQYGASPHSTNSRNESPLAIAVRQRCYDVVLSLIMGGALVESCTAVHEAAKVGCPAILMLLLRHGGKTTGTDGHGVTPMGVAAEYGHTEALDILLQHGGDVNAQASNGDSVLYDAAGSGNLDCIELLLQNGANPNIASYACQLPIHRAAYEGHFLALRCLVPITTKRAIRLSGQSPVHSAADGGHLFCLELLIQRGFDVNALLATHISENYGDLRRSSLYFAVSNGDLTCTEMLLKAGARTDLDYLRCLLVAVRAERHEMVRLLLSHGAEVNCYFRVINDTSFPTALQYCLKDAAMLRLLLDHGYHAHKCFECNHDDSDELDSSWINVHNQAYAAYRNATTVTFCEFVSVSWLVHLVGGVVRMLLDYVSYVRLCPNLQTILETTPEWPEICSILAKASPTPLPIGHQRSHEPQDPQQPRCHGKRALPPSAEDLPDLHREHLTNQRSSECVCGY